MQTPTATVTPTSKPFVVEPTNVKPNSIPKTINLYIDNNIMYINGIGHEIDSGRGTKPILLEGRTLLPIRGIIEKIGGNISWDQKIKKTTIKYNGETIELFIGKKTANVNGQNKKMDVCPEIINDRTMLPLRFISENLGMKVEWDSRLKKISIIVN